MDELHQLEDWVKPLMLQIAPKARRKLAVDVGKALRKSQQDRIKAQLNPDGSRFAARKAQTGRIKARAMFVKLKRNKHLKVRANADKISVAFYGKVARVARVHQKGLRDRAHKNAREVRYAKRELLGFTESDKELMLSTIIAHLSR